YFKIYLPEGLFIDFGSTGNILFLLVLSVAVTLLSGIYPALILSNYQPELAMKSSQVAGRKFILGLFLRKNLTVIQFSLSIMFVIGIFVINKQMLFLTSQSMGFDKDLIAYAQAPYMDPSKNNSNLVIKAKLEQQSFVQGVSLSSDVVASSGLWTSRIEFGNNDSKMEYEVQVKEIDSDFLKVNGLSLVAGRNINEVPGEMLINETLMHQMGYEAPEDILGETLDFNEEHFLVVGVIKDFHTRSLKETIGPLIMYNDISSYQVITVRLESGVPLVRAKKIMEELYQ